MKQLDGNPHVLQLQDAIINPFYCILQFPAMDMDLNTYLAACKNRIMPCRNRLSSAKQLTNAVAFLKEKRILHRDLHSGNALPLVHGLIGCMQQP
jgi:serine/threonine protein kinase